MFLTRWTAVIGFFGCFGELVHISLYYDPYMQVNLTACWNEHYATIRHFMPVLN